MAPTSDYFPDSEGFERFINFSKGDRIPENTEDLEGIYENLVENIIDSFEDVLSTQKFERIFDAIKEGYIDNPLVNDLLLYSYFGDAGLSDREYCMPYWILPFSEDGEYIRYLLIFCDTNTEEEDVAYFVLTDSHPSSDNSAQREAISQAFKRVLNPGKYEYGKMIGEADAAEMILSDRELILGLQCVRDNPPYITLDMASTRLFNQYGQSHS